MKKRFQTGGNIHAVPASRQNAEPRTPSGVRPVSSPVAPIKSDVQGVMKHGGEVKDMKKPKKMALGGPAGRLTQQFGGKGADRGGMGRPYSGPANPPPNYVGTAGNIPGGFMGGQRGPGVNVGANIGPGAGGMPIGGGLGGFGGIGPIGGKPSDMRYPVGPNGGPAGPGNLYSSDRGMGVDQGGYADFISQRDGNRAAVSQQMGAMPRGPAMKKGGKVSASSYNDMTGGAGGGIGRLEKTSIASKTKSQKLKKGGKVKGYYSGGDIGKQVSGGDYLSEGDRLAMKKAGIDPNAGTDRSIAMAEYRARQDAAEKRARERAAEKRARKATETPRNAGGGPRGSAVTGGENQMRGMGLYPFGPDSNNVDLARDAQYAKDNRGKSGGRGSMSKNAGNGDMIGPASSFPAAGTGGGRGGKRNPTTSPIEGGVSFRIEPRSGSTVYEPAPRPKVVPNKGEDRIRTDRPRSSSQASSDPFAIDMRRMSDPIKEYQRTHDRYGRKLDENGRPLDYAGNPIAQKKGGKVKMAKGGKAEAFEGTAKDMAQDKKLAKKHGMSLKDYERSSIDKKHDEQRSMKGLKKGGMAKKMASGGSSDPYTDLAARKEVRAKGKAPDFATAFFGPSIRSSSDTRAKLRGIGRRTGLPDTRNQEDTKAGKMSGMKKGGKASAHEKGCKCMACGGMAKYAMGGSVSTSQTGMKTPLRPKPSAMAKMATGGAVKSGKTFGKPLPGTKVSSKVIRSTVSTGGANMKKDGMKGALRAKASGAKPTNMMKPLGMTKMASGGKVRGTGIAQRGTKFIGEV